MICAARQGQDPAPRIPSAHQIARGAHQIARGAPQMAFCAQQIRTSAHQSALGAANLFRLPAEPGLGEERIELRLQLSF